MKNSSSPPLTGYWPNYLEMSMTLEELFAEHAGASFEKQFRLSAVVGELPWQYSTESGILSFGNELRFPAQILGTHAEGDNSWLWAWANQQSNLPKHITSASAQVR